MTAADRERLLALDYLHFDQDLPAGGWRKFHTEGSHACDLEIRDITDAYVAKHDAELKPWQRDVLHWHSGQMSAIAGDGPRARAAMLRSIKPAEQPTDVFLWNPYARATIAFLEKDRKALVAERALLAAGTSPFNHSNLRIVDGFLRCFDTPYEQAMLGQCQPAETRRDKVASLAIEVTPGKPLVAGLADYFSQKKLIVIGDDHGVTDPIVVEIARAISDPSVKTAIVGDCEHRAWRAAAAAFPGMTLHCAAPAKVAAVVAELAGKADAILVQTDAATALAARAAVKLEQREAVTIAVHTSRDSADEAAAMPSPAFFMEEHRYMGIPQPSTPEFDALLFVR